MHLAEFMPPIIHRRLSKLWSTQSPQYSSFAEAERACGPGYQEHELISLVVEKTRRARQRLQSNTVAEVDLAALRMLPGLDAFGGDQPFNVVDFGGGCGYHGLIINKALGQQSRVKWYVIETPAMVQAAKEMEDENLRFFSSIEEAAKAIDKIHVLYSSGTLQYLPNPCATLAHLLAIANPQTVRLTRLALTPLSNDQYFRQRSNLGSNGPGALPPTFQDRPVNYPLTITSASQIEATLKLKYQITMKIYEGDSGYALKNLQVPMLGYIASRL